MLYESCERLEVKLYFCLVGWQKGCQNVRMSDWRIVTVKLGVKPETPKGYIGYQVYGYNSFGQRVRTSFGDRKKAEEFLQQCVEAEKRGDPYEHEMVRYARLTWMTDKQIAFCEQAYRVFSGINEIQYNLVDSQLILKAAEAYVAQQAKASNQIEKSLADAIADFLKEKVADGCRDAYTKPLKYRLDQFAKKVGQNGYVYSIEKKVVSDYLYEISDFSTRKTVRGNLRAFFNWCLEKSLINESPITKTKELALPPAEPKILSIDNVERMLVFAHQHRNGVALAYTILNLFCGVRPDEAARLNWDAINLDERGITIAGIGTKVKRRRVSELPEVAISWLRLCDKRMPIDPGRRAKDSLKRAAGYSVESGGVKNDPTLPAWPSDGMRHTCLSYRLALTQDAAGTAHWAGTSEDVLHEHYKGLVPHGKAQEYWKLTPERLGIKTFSSELGEQATK